MIAVTTAAEAREADRAAVQGGTESFELMRRAGDRAAHFLLERVPSLRGSTVQVLAGAGNNGGDGYVMATALQRAGCVVGVLGIDVKSDDAKRAKSLCANVSEGIVENPHLVLDAVLGTGSSGELRRDIAGLLEAANRVKPAHWVAVDLPSGLDATTGVADPRTVPADLTVTFGSWKLGTLMRRDLCGELTCLDIGLPPFSFGLAQACDEAWAADIVPPIGARANKSDRKRLLVVGGSRGMAGAASLAAAGALHSGIGMVRCAVASESLTPIQLLVPQAVAEAWGPSGGPADSESLGWGHAMVVGPGFGTLEARARATAWLDAFRGPVVIDADALSAFAGAMDELRRVLTAREGSAILTPHATEAAKLLETDPARVTADPLSAVLGLAASSGATVLLKGVPTLVATGRNVSVVPRGTPALAAGGSGDILAGIAGTLAAQMPDAHAAAALAALVHGRAGEIVSTGRPLRGIVLRDVLDAMTHAWRFDARAHPPNVLGVLPMVGERER